MNDANLAFEIEEALRRAGRSLADRDFAGCGHWASAWVPLARIGGGRQ